MKIVEFKEFCSLPDGTIFAYLSDCCGIAEGLWRRGEVIFSDGRPMDYFEADILAARYNCGPFQLDEAVGRWGMYEYEQKYLIYEEPDLSRMIAILTTHDHPNQRHSQLK